MSVGIPRFLPGAGDGAGPSGALSKAAVGREDEEAGGPGKC